MAYSCKQYALWLLARKSYAVKDLQDKLCKKYLVQEVEEVIKYLINSKLLNDSDFGSSRAAFLSRSKSNRQIEYDLKQKGLSEEDTHAAIDQLDSEEDRIKKLVEFKQITEDNFDKWLSKLCRKGFSYKTVLKILKQNLNQSEES